MKKKIFICLLLIVGTLAFTACKKNNLDLSNYLIEERYNIYSAQDSNYVVTFSSGMRENNYDLDGIKNEMVEFGILTISKLNHTAMATDSYKYSISIGEETLTGELGKDDYYNGSYSVDVQKGALNDEDISVVISFTGYTFNEKLVNNSKDFNVDKNTALQIANNELKQELATLAKDKNNKFEVIMKIVNDYSGGENKTYFWYVGLVTTNAETIGVLIDANTGEIISKKV